MIKRYGDIQLIDYGEDYLMIACDSSGGIGNKPADTLSLEPEIAGYYAAFVPLVECMAIRGKILSIVDTLAVEMVPTGQRIIQGVHKAIVDIGGNVEQLTGSTEDNMETVMTGIGVTVLGCVSKKNVDREWQGKSKEIFCIGIPKVGQVFFEEEIVAQKGEVMSLALMKKLSQCSWIEHMLPVGSKGIEHELQVLTQRYQQSVEVEEKIVDPVTGQKISISQSAGPATCLLVVVEKKECLNLEKIRKKIPVTYVGCFKE